MVQKYQNLSSLQHNSRLCMSRCLCVGLHNASAPPTQLQTAIVSRLQNQGIEPQINVSIHSPHLQMYRNPETTMFYVYILLILCYAPYWSMFIVVQLIGRDSTKIAALSFSMTVLFANASLKPFLYSWRMHEIRHEILTAMSNIFQRK